VSAHFALALGLFVTTETRFLHQPDLGPDSIAFVHGDELWTAPLAGGPAKRVTSLEGKKSYPRFSPDGSRIAFSCEVAGNVDVYVTAAGEDRPRRLTYHPSADMVQGWSPDGSRILFSSDRVSDHFRSMLFTLDLSGGHPEPFPMHKAFRGALSPDGKTLAYTPIGDAFRTWKRYRGGQTTPIWLVNLEDYTHAEIPHENASDTSPLWMGNDVYFLSDRSEVMSLFRYERDSAKVSEIHRNGGSDIDSFGGRGTNLVYARTGYLFLLDLQSGESRRVPITVPEEPNDRAVRSKNVSEEVLSVAISPDGSELAIEAHGEIAIASSSGPPFRNFTRTGGTAERSPAWSPDGRSVAYFSDADGEYRLHIVETSRPSAGVALGKPGLGYQIRWSPDGSKLSYIDRFRKLRYVDVAAGTETFVDGEVDRGDAYAWSPDGRFIAYPDFRPTLFRNLAIYSLDSGKSATLTDGIGDAHRPGFSRDGSTVYFLGSTNAGKAKTGLDLSVISHVNEVRWSVYRVKLSERIVERLPVPAARYVDLMNSAEDELFLLEDPGESTFAGKRRLARFDPDTRKVEPFLDGVDECELSADGRKILYRSDSSWGVVGIGERPAPGAGRIDLASLEVEVDPPAEWRQIFLDAWRAQRDFFYDENLHGVDWSAMRERYEAWLPDLRHRSDLNYVLQQLVGELVNSHIAVGSRSSLDEKKESVGLLGADYEVVEGRYRIKRIVRGSYWDEESGPLAAPGLGIREGDYILEVNGKELRAPRSLYSLFVDTVGKPVTLRVHSEPTLDGSRFATVTPIGSEAAIRRRSWIEANRKKVDELSGGRIAYVYQPDTSDDSLTEFDRYFFPQSDRQAVLLDERFNRGGGDPDYQLDILDRQQVHWYRNRNEAPFKAPYFMIPGPKVMLVNAEASSGGDVYPYQFKIRGLGDVVGTRTWGGVQGGGAGPPLIDGGFVRVPNLGTWAPDGEYILENMGFTPDVEVEIFPLDDARGRDPQLERAVEILLEMLERNPLPPVPSLETVNRSRKNPSR
jgi:tricorn protease